MPRLVIAPKGDKGRSFTAELLAYAEANFLWEHGGGGDAKRPVWMVVAGSEQEMRSFNANLLTGKRADIGNHWRRSSASDRFEILKSAGYLTHSRKIGNALVTTYLLPDLLRIDPGMVDPKTIRFAVLPPKAWVSAQSFDVAAARTRLLDLAEITPEDIQSMVRKYDSNAETVSPLLTDDGLHLLLAEGSLLLAYLDRRCRYPIPFDPIFGAWLVIVSKYNRLLVRPDNSYSGTYKVTGAESVNVLPGFAFTASHETFGEVLSAAIRKWHGSSRVRPEDR